MRFASSAHAETVFVQFVSAYTGECPQPAFGSSALGAPIAEETCNGSLAQQWTVASASSGVGQSGRTVLTPSA